MRLLQEFVGSWQQITFGPGDRALPTAMHLKEEAEELIVELKQTDVAQRPAEIRRELADIVILVIGVAYRLKVDLHDAVMEKMAENLARSWQAPDKDGIVRHEEGK